MYRVIIVEDEPLVRVGIKSTIDWEALDLILVGEAENGLEALTMIQETPPDILLLDICMPKMDGIQLMKALRDMELQPQILILSCHNDMEYVKQAIRLGAYDYILKLTLTQEELAQHLREMARRCRHPAALRYNEPLTDTDLLIHTVLHGNNPDLDSPRFLEACKQICSGVNRLILFRSGDHRQLVFCKSIIEDYLSHRYRKDNLYVECTGQYIAAVLLDGRDVEAAIRQLVAVLREYTQNHAVAVLCQAFTEYADLAERYTLALEAMDQVFYDEGIAVILPEESRLHSSPLLSIELYQQIREGLAAMQYQQVEALVGSDILDAAFLARPHSGSLKETVIEVVNLYLSDLLRLCEGSDEDDRPYKRYIDEILELPSFHALKSWYRDFHCWYTETVSCIAGRRRRHDILVAQCYITCNYHRKLYLSEVAAHIHMSSNYFSIVFRQETGLGFIDYLNNIRIDKAKELILMHDYKVYEVSERVGFSSTNYFIKYFKKRIGLSPMQYRNQIVMTLSAASEVESAPHKQKSGRSDQQRQ